MCWADRRVHLQTTLPAIHSTSQPLVTQHTPVHLLRTKHPLNQSKAQPPNPVIGTPTPATAAPPATEAEADADPDQRGGHPKLGPQALEAVDQVLVLRVLFVFLGGLMAMGDLN